MIIHWLKKVYLLLSLSLAINLVSCNGGHCLSSSSKPSPSPTPTPTITITPNPSPTAAPTPEPTPGVVILDTNDGSIANNATNVSLTPAIVLRFPYPMVPSSINNDTIIVSSSANGANPVTLTAFTSSQDNTQFHFSSASKLATNTLYYIIVKNTTATDGVTENANFSFTTGTVSTPSVSLVTPINNAIGVWNTTTIQINFSQNVTGVNTNNVELHLGSSSGPTVAISSITANAESALYTITPASPLEYLTTYYLTLNSGITSSAGDALNPTTFQFTTTRAPILYITDFSEGTVIRCALDTNGTGSALKQ
jgi:hypothetical protein